MINRIVLNDYFSKEVQQDVLKAKPVLMHSEAIQKVIDSHVKPGMIVTMYGTFNLDKLPANYMADYYGQPNRKIHPKVTLHGSQPCLSISSNDNTWDFTGCTFIVHRMFQDGIHFREYIGNNTVVNLGKWFTKRILDVDPNYQAETDRLALQRGSVKWLPSIDGDTGMAVKGMGPSAEQKTKSAGFNTTTYPVELSPFRSNAADTSKITYDGGQGGGYNGQFPQEDGTTAPTWGTWGGGWIGNWNAAVYVTQNPNFDEAVRLRSRFHILDGYIRGWAYCGIQVGNVGTPDGQQIGGRIEEIEKWTAYNVTIKNVMIEDCHESGIQRTRFDNMIIDNVVVRRMGHPEWGMHHAKPGKPNVTQIDPGYGTSSGRQNVQGKLVITNSKFIDCNRKGIDAHHGTSTVITNNYIKAGFWGIQVVLEEKQADTKDVNWEHQVCSYVIANNEIHAGIRGIDFANGGFGPVVRLSQRQWFLKASVKILNNTIFAPVGWYYNYAHDGFILENNTFVFSLPYGKYYMEGNEGNKSYGIYHGSILPGARGLGVGDIVRGNRVMNSPYGNFGHGIVVNSGMLTYMENNLVDVTPYKKKTIADSYGEPFISNFDEVWNNNLATNPYLINAHQIEFKDTNNYSFNRRDLGSSLRKYSYTPNEGTLKTDIETSKIPERTVNIPKVSSSDPNNWYPDFEDVVQGGENAPVGWKGVTSDKPPMVHYARVAKPSSTAGVYPIVHIPKVDKTTKDTIVFKTKVIAMGRNQTGPLISTGTMLEGTGVPLIQAYRRGADYAKAEFREKHTIIPLTDSITLNGTLIPRNKEVEIQLDTEYEIRVLTDRLNGRDSFNLGAPFNGNNQISADFYDVAIYRGRDLLATNPLPNTKVETPR